MARVVEPLTKEKIKVMTVANLRKEYIRVADFLRSVINGNIIYCPRCGSWKAASGYYSSTTSIDGIEHYGCKECIVDECTDTDKSTKTRTDNKEKTIRTFRRLDWCFDEAVYDAQVESVTNSTTELTRSTGVQQFIVMLKSLPQYRGFTFSDSRFTDNDKSVIELETKRKPRKEIIKIFGSGFSVEDYLYLQDQYDDWKSRTQIDSKSSETYIVRICFKLLDIYKAQKSGKDTDKLDRSLNDLMASANLQPRQNVGNSSTDTLTFGQLIEKWELEEPIPKPSKEFLDVDEIGKKLRVFFSGHLMRVLGLDNGYNKEYDEYMKKYTVDKPKYNGVSGNGDTTIYNKLFGSSGEE